MSTSNGSASRGTLLVVGPKRTRYTGRDLSELRSTITTYPDLSFMLETIGELETLWPVITESCPELKGLHGAESLQTLNQFFQGGDLADLTQACARHDNILLDLITVISHVVDFWQIAKNRVHNDLFLAPESTTNGEGQKQQRMHDIQGFCLGFLTAAAVASAHNRDQLVANFKIILRLALCIAALVEADAVDLRRLGARAASLSVSWSSDAEHDELVNVLSNYPDAYIACTTDKARATVIILDNDSSCMSEELSVLGFSVRSISLQGRYHCRSAYTEDVRSLKALFDRDVRFRLPDAADMPLSLRSNVDGNIITQGALHEIAVESVLLEQCQWYETVQKATAKSGIMAENIVTVGSELTVPRSLINPSSSRSTRSSTPPNPLKNRSNNTIVGDEDEANAVAIIGMSCRYPDADCLEEFWDLLQDGHSAVRPLPTERFKVSEVTREPRDNPFWGNFLRSPDTFDHRFFGLSGREAKSMDPQQRLILQVAYEALESAGYFGVETSAARFPQDVGCYLGVGSVDYSDNIASHEATAFSALGTLRAFISGRISHHFGWSGPSITYDTACSSGAVAIHSAVSAIRSGECSLALTGGVNVITSPALFQNLAAASFLSPTGASKAFDANANGYCRGEGAGLVLLKSLALARADGDSILAVITGSAVNQGGNCSPITVPVSDSQTALYRKALSISGTAPDQVTFVEAHGTGTPVGDPIECESIRRTFGGSNRTQELFLGSVKDNIGHTEASSGAAALIKTVLMIQKGVIPKQAGFTRLNPKIPPLEPDRINVPRQTQQWRAAKRVAVINNYGAAGSNAAIVVREAGRRQSTPVTDEGHREIPFFVSAKTPQSLRQYCKVLLSSLPTTRLQDLAYNLSVKQNRGFECSYSFTASTLDEVAAKLSQAQSETCDFNKIPTSPRSVVLCIGGQTGRAVQVNETLYRHSCLLRKHLDACEQACQSLGLPSLYPVIFSPDPVQDLVSLHSQLFALQYASAKAWLDSGLKVDTIIGHSFGQLTALVVADSLSLTDGLNFVSARARLIQEAWGKETGAMLSVQGDKTVVDQLLQSAKSQHPTLSVEISCYNGPQSIVLAGDRLSIDAVEDMAKEDFSQHLKVSKLKNTHAFHSILVDAILPGLREVAATLSFRRPSICIEACSENHEVWNEKIDAETIVQHSREPVYFHNAVQRIGARLGSCVFVEAGSASPIIPMARKVLATRPQVSGESVFQSIDIGTPNALDVLSKATCNLWAAGVSVQYWPFHHSQKENYTWMNLPPYQFQKNSHWIDYIPAQPTTKDATSQPTIIQDETQPQSVQLLDLCERDYVQGSSTFRINTAHELFACCTRGHAVLGQSLCPASMYIELAVRAANLASDNDVLQSLAPCVKELSISAPLSLSSHRCVELQLVSESKPDSWTFEVLSRSEPEGIASIKHATGIITFTTPRSYLDTPRMQVIRRLIGQNKYDEVTSSPGAQALNGSIIYQVFGQVVDYAPHYRGVVEITSKDREAVSLVHVPREQPSALDEATCDPISLDNFLQVAGIHVNCLTPRNAEEVFVCTQLGEVFISHAFLAKQTNLPSYRVYTSFVQGGDKKTLVNDIFVFDPDTGETMVLFLGASFHAVPSKSLARTLAKLNSTTEGSMDDNSSSPVSRRTSYISTTSRMAPASPPSPPSNWDAKRSSIVSAVAEPADSAGYIDILRQMRELLGRVIEIPVEEVKPSAMLSSLGVDSLMSTEILNEIKNLFNVVIPSEQFLLLKDVESIAKFLSPRLSVGSGISPSTTLQIQKEGAPPVVHIPANSAQNTNGLSTSFSQVQEFLGGILEISADEIAADMTMDDLGIDSLLATEVLAEIKKRFGVTISAEEFQDLRDVLALATRLQGSTGLFTPPLSQGDTAFSSPRRNDDTYRLVQDFQPGSVSGSSECEPGDENQSASVACDAFATVKRDFDSICQDVKFADFYAKVYPVQMRLVVTYIVEAFQNMNCSLSSLRAGDKVPTISLLSKHDKVKRQIYKILETADLIKQDASGGFIRTTTPVPTTPSSQLHRSLIADFPQHVFEHNLLASTGPKLAECLTGRTDPLSILFGSATARTLMENVYTHAPMFKAGTVNLARYLVNFLVRFPSNRPVRILELGAGTGGTTKHLIESLLSTGRRFEYTFTDLSSSLVAAARKKFAQYDFMRYAMLNIEESPSPEVCGQYDIVLSTNCIHATKDLTRSCTNIRACLQPDGILCLVELTRNLFWFDLVFGLLSGWWLFEDGRQHALASENLWREHLVRSGFSWIDWTSGTSEESNVLRVITASPTNVAQQSPQVSLEFGDETSEPLTMETIAFKRVDNIALQADLYYPDTEQSNGVQVRPVALMIHGGGHVMLSRKDIRPAQTRTLLAAGLLPISIDYRLCPETTLPDGPMVDVRDALAWARNVLPQLNLRRSDICADGTRVVAIGWSTGGHLALSLGFTAHLRGIRPPDATLVFYCPSDYEDPFWARPNRPFDQDKGAGLKYDLLEGVQEGAITAYNPPAERRALGGWMSTADPRSRIALHMNWTGRYLRVLLNGLRPRTHHSTRGDMPVNDPTDLLPEPTQAQIQAVSPLAQIRQGNYRVPTFIIHGTKDDLIPWQQAARTYDALKEQGVSAELRILDGAVHLFDMYKSFEGDEMARRAVDEAYQMLVDQIM